MQARLVTLAACDAAVTSGRPGMDEIISFPAALLRAGAGQVLAPFWSVDDTSTLRIMQGFYRGLAANEGADLAALLRDSAAALRTGAPQVMVEAPPARRKSFWQRLRSAPQAAVTADVAEEETRSGLARTRVDRSHPHHWAAFTIHGLPDEVGT